MPRSGQSLLACQSILAVFFVFVLRTRNDCPSFVGHNRSLRADASPLDGGSVELRQINAGKAVFRCEDKGFR